MGSAVMGLAMVKAGTRPDVQRALDVYHAAETAFGNAMVELAEVDPTVDVGPLFGR